MLVVQQVVFSEDDSTTDGIGTSQRQAECDCIVASLSVQ